LSRDRTTRDTATGQSESGPSQAPSSSLDDPRHEIRQPGSAPENTDQEPELDSTSDDIYAGDSTLIGIDEIANALIENNKDLDLLCYLMSKALDATDDSLPVTYRDLMKLPDYQKIEWLKACKEEMESLEKRAVFDVVDLPEGKKAIKCCWVFAIKSNGRKKAHLVAKGFSQVEGIDFNEVFSPMVRYDTAHILIALFTIEGWKMESLDVITAFLYGKLEEEIYMEQPEGYALPGQERKVFRLNRALYGLKQALLAWWNQLDESMKALGFTRIHSDAGIFVLKDKNGKLACVTIIYVNDALFCSPDWNVTLNYKQLFMH